MISIYVVNGRGRLARLDIPDMGDTWDSVSSAFPTFFDMVPSASVLGCSLSEHDPNVDGVFTPGMEPELVEWFQEASRWRSAPPVSFEQHKCHLATSAKDGIANKNQKNTKKENDKGPRK